MPHIIIPFLLHNFISQLADFGLAHASKDGSICLEAVNNNITGTPGIYLIHLALLFKFQLLLSEERGIEEELSSIFTNTE